MKTTTLLQKGLIAVGAATAISLGMSAPAQAMNFTGAYDVSNWTFSTDGNGSVNTSGAPGSLILNGSDDSGFGGNALTTFTTTAVSGGSVSFDWLWDSTDPDSGTVGGPAFDPFGYILNGVLTQLTDNNGADYVAQSGSVLFNVVAGDIFGFYTSATDDILGPSTITISNFSAPETVPTPAAVLPILSGLLAAERRRKNGVEEEA